MGRGAFWVGLGGRGFFKGKRGRGDVRRVLGGVGEGDVLELGGDRGGLESGFALIREAAEWLRAGRELGFGALADPQGWLERIEGMGAALEPGEFMDAASLLETAGWLRQQFREEAVKFPLLAARGSLLGGFRGVHAAIRRCVLPNGGNLGEASARPRP